MNVILYHLRSALAVFLRSTMLSGNQPPSVTVRSREITSRDLSILFIALFSVRYFERELHHQLASCSREGIMKVYSHAHLLMFPFYFHIVVSSGALTGAFCWSPGPSWSGKRIGLIPKLWLISSANHSQDGFWWKSYIAFYFWYCLLHVQHTARTNSLSLTVNRNCFFSKWKEQQKV